MNEVLVALIGLVGVLGVGYMEHGRRTSNRRWQKNSEDHNFVVDKIENLGKSLGRSIDRVEETAVRTENKLDQHINDHMTGKLSGQEKVRRRKLG
jgi:hypothetical protein